MNHKQVIRISEALISAQLFIFQYVKLLTLLSPNQGWMVSIKNISEPCTNLEAITKIFGIFSTLSTYWKFYVKIISMTWEFVYLYNGVSHIKLYCLI